MNMVTVYKTTPDHVAVIINLLKRNGLNPVSLDNPDPTLLYASKGTVRVRIAVPKDQAGQARKVLTDWERSAKTSVGAITQSLRMQFLLSILITAFFAGIFILTKTIEDLFVHLLFIWFVSFVLIANLDRIRNRFFSNHRQK